MHILLSNSKQELYCYLNTIWNKQNQKKNSRKKWLLKKKLKQKMLFKMIYKMNIYPLANSLFFILGAILVPNKYSNTEYMRMQRTDFAGFISNRYVKEKKPKSVLRHKLTPWRCPWHLREIHWLCIKHWFVQHHNKTVWHASCRWKCSTVEGIGLNKLLLQTQSFSESFVSGVSSIVGQSAHVAFSLTYDEQKNRIPFKISTFLLVYELFYICPSKTLPTALK